MSNAFKRGDKVRRISEDFQELKVGQTYTVERMDVGGLHDVAVVLKGHHGRYCPDKFELVQSIPDTKASNPKDVIGDTKLDYSVIPSTVLAYLSTAFFEGAAKYGKLNWRHSGVRGSVYTNALERHLQKYIGGEFVDPETGVPHLASVMACAGIILDAGIHGKLTDDRPDESKESVELIPVCASIQQKLKAMHKDKKPIHYTRDRDNGTN